MSSEAGKTAGDAMADEEAGIIRIIRCPICGKPKEERFRPFCSKRCADLDLSRWFNGVYAAPAKEEDTEDEDF